MFDDSRRASGISLNINQTGPPSGTLIALEGHRFLAMPCNIFHESWPFKRLFIKSATVAQRVGAKLE